MPLVLDDRSPSAARRTVRPGSRTSTSPRRPQPRRPAGIGAADQQRSLEPAPNERQPLEAVLEGALVKEQLGPVRAARSRRSARSSMSNNPLIAGACAAAELRRQAAGWRWQAIRIGGAAGARLRAAAALRRLRRRSSTKCTASAPTAGSRSISSARAAARPAGCRSRRPRPSECGACLAQPPRIERTRSAVAYDELSRSIAIRLKYGRKVALARTMARYMAPLVRAESSKRAPRPGAAASQRLVAARVQPVGAGRPRACRGGSGIAADPFALRRVSARRRSRA